MLGLALLAHSQHFGTCQAFQERLLKEWMRPRSSVETQAGKVQVEELGSLSPEQMHHLIQNTLMLPFLRLRIFSFRMLRSVEK